jgi:hypothetical protein
VFVEIRIVDAHAPIHFIFFSTRTGFANHLGCSTSLMNPAATKRANSARIASLLSGMKRHNFCRIGLAWGIDLQFVLGQFSRDSRHIRRLPCEYVSVILQKLYERAFLFVIQAGADDGSLAFISEPEVDSLCFLSRPHRGHGLSFICRYCEVHLRL